jgi:hypothetical protein
MRNPSSRVKISQKCFAVDDPRKTAIMKFSAMLTLVIGKRVDAT